MQSNKILLLVLLCTYSIFTSAQTLSSLKGRIKNSAGEPVPAATAKILNTSLGAITNEAGLFVIKHIKPGSYTLSISLVGYKTQTRHIDIAGKETELTITLDDDLVTMETVMVTGLTAAQESNRQAYNITAVDAKKLYNTTLNLADALDRVSGVRVRESGGVGSNFNLSLNGFSGSRVRFFIDGIPMDNFGSSFQINNIPINIAERVEVYKGVVPIWLGSDALGGAINIITGNRYRNYIDASYSYGSFNTHRSVINAAATSKSGFTFQLNAFQNYSDNNYKVYVGAADIYTGANGGKFVFVPRFHDKYHNETLIANVGVVDKSFADKLLLGVTLGKNYQEIQTGARMESVFGAWHRRGNIVMPSLKYKKDNLLKNLDVTLNANYNFGTEQNIDTVDARFDWYGNSKPGGTGGGERSRSLYKYKNNNGIVNTMLNYRIAENQSIALSDVFTTFNRKGTDELKIEQDDAPKKTQKNVLGLGYSYNIESVWSASVFGKYIYQNTVTSDRNTTSTMNKFGYGIAGTYFLTKDFQLKASYELTNRMPEADEIFGDVINSEGNPNLKPEKSQNLNAGAAYAFAINSDNKFMANATFTYRKSDNFVYSRLNQNQTKLIPDNRDGVNTVGVDGEIRYSYKNWLNAGTTLTYQYLQNLQLYEVNPSTGQYYTTKSDLYGDQMPNIPYFFGNTDVAVTLKGIGGTKNKLTFGYNLLYVHAFWLYWPSRGTPSTDTKKVVPMQLSHDVNVVYSMADGRYNISLEGRNITNELLYDNFSLQKPGRGFYLNLRYFINKTNN
ncbi:TonB-dependent receptor [Mucilaginibacter limnophilus]|uniref:TonB-dependent receptor n=1 Tax=Mucilaginibacter limnophilus TaxID=1932778 RepID=A0A437MRZ0_9SPHI|nr:TonB-dependent receptor [Mucilaginibacter limnophilus]RVU00407.1 TonB-dependent receptor [Mucilaginibacter limnophilus]